MARIENILGYKVKIVERSGTPLKLMFPLTKIGGGQECGRPDCRTCTQETRGEQVPPCTKRNVLYENICVRCNPDVGEENKEKKGWSPPTTTPSIYVGETAKSLYERGKEHWYGYKSKADDSHILKHHLLHHGGIGEPQFHLRPVRFHQTALTRQIHEAVRIQRWGEDVVLNSKGEYNRCKISRLTLGEENKDGHQPVMVNEEEGDQSKEESSVRNWEKGRAEIRRAHEVREVINLEKGLVRSPARKRCGDQPTIQENSTTTDSSKKRRKVKLKYPVMKEDWGMEIEPPPPTTEEKVTQQPPPTPTCPKLESDHHEKQATNHNPPCQEERNIATPPPPPTPTCKNKPPLTTTTTTSPRPTTTPPTITGISSTTPPPPPPTTTTTTNPNPSPVPTSPTSPTENRDGHQPSREGKEDDQKNLDDDQKNLEDDRNKKDGVNKLSGSVSPARLVKKVRLVTNPPPKTRSPQGGVGVVPDNSGGAHSLSVVVRTEHVQTRAVISPDKKRSDVAVEDTSVRRNLTGSITVNGINLMELQKLRGSPVSKEKTPRRSGQKNNKKKDETPVPSSGKISSYFVRKRANQDDRSTGMSGNKEDKDKTEDKTNEKEEEEEEERMRKTGTLKQIVSVEEPMGKKTTFTPVKKPHSASVKENIRMFQELANKDECVWGSGRCSTHNTRLVRKVVMKKVSEVSNKGHISWPMREVCTFACPNKLDKQSNSEASAENLVPAKSVGTNRTKKFCFDEKERTNHTE